MPMLVVTKSSVDLQRLCDRVEDLLRDLGGIVRRLEIGQQDGELVAAHAGDRVLFP